MTAATLVTATVVTAAVVTAAVVTAKQPIQDAHRVFSFGVSVSGPRLRTTTGTW
jgi:hypothetical protein